MDDQQEGENVLQHCEIVPTGLDVIMRLRYVMTNKGVMICCSEERTENEDVRALCRC